MKMAVGTSLVIIAAKSLIGFFGEGGETHTDWQFLAIVSAFAILGIFIGSRMAKNIDGNKLKPAFGWFCTSDGNLYFGKGTFWSVKWNFIGFAENDNILTHNSNKFLFINIFGL
jgi:hypothetical protein